MDHDGCPRGAPLAVMTSVEELIPSYTHDPHILNAPFYCEMLITISYPIFLLFILSLSLAPVYRFAAHMPASFFHRHCHHHHSIFLLFSASGVVST